MADASKCGIGSARTFGACAVTTTNRTSPGKDVLGAASTLQLSVWANGDCQSHREQSEERRDTKARA